MSTVTIAETNGKHEPLYEGPWETTEDKYYADTTCVSNSMMGDFLEWRPLYYARHVAKSVPADEPTAAMQLGTALHYRLFEPLQFADRVAFKPKFGRSKAELEEKAAWESQHAGLVILDEDKRESIEKMAEAALAHDEVAHLLDLPSEREQPCRWIDDDTGLWCKGKPDLRTRRIMADLKTTAQFSKQSILRNVFDRGYHRQAAFYIDGVKRIYGERCAFIHVFVQTEAPWGVVVFRLDSAAIDLGRATYRRALRGIKECHETGDWTDPAGRGVNEWSLPRWAFYTE